MMRRGGPCRSVGQTRVFQLWALNPAGQRVTSARLADGKLDRGHEARAVPARPCPHARREFEALLPRRQQGARRALADVGSTDKDAAPISADLALLARLHSLCAPHGRPESC